MLSKEFKYYLENQTELLKKYKGKVLVIKDQQVVDVYDSYDEAVFGAAKKYELGTFLVQECTEGEDAYTQTFHSRVIFA